MENLRSNVIKLLLVEIVLLIILSNFKLDVFVPFIILLAFAVNITFTYYLFRYKPKWYLFLVLLLALPVIIPIAFFIAALILVQC